MPIVLILKKQTEDDGHEFKDSSVYITISRQNQGCIVIIFCRERLGRKEGGRKMKEERREQDNNYMKPGKMAPLVNILEHKPDADLDPCPPQWKKRTDS